MLNSKELTILKRDLKYFNEFISRIDHYDILYLTRSQTKDKFSSFDIYNEWKNIGDEIKNGVTSDKLEMYIHIPFCEEFCDFCVYYKQLLIKDKEKTIEKYIDYIIKQMEFYAPAFKGATFKCLSIGGGTPSILTSRQIKKLFGRLFELFKFDEYAYRGIEFRPSSTNEDKLKALKEVGFETIHFGVQSLDSKVLENMNRISDTEQEVKKSIDLVKKYKFDNLIVHLIRGLKGDTVEKFQYTLEKLCEYGVGDISIYGLITKDFYLKKHYGFNKTEFYNGWYSDFSNELKLIIPNIGDKYGFRYKSKMDIYDHDWGLENVNWKRTRQKYGYGDISTDDINLFGFGPTARSFREGKIIYEGEKKVVYNFNPEEKIYLGKKLSQRNEMKRKILTGFRDHDKASRIDFKNYFGNDLLEEFEDEFKILKFLGKINIDNEYVYFLEKNKKMRMLYCMFIVGREDVNKSFESNGWNNIIW